MSSSVEVDASLHQTLLECWAFHPQGYQSNILFILYPRAAVRSGFWKITIKVSCNNPFKPPQRKFLHRITANNETTKTSTSSTHKSHALSKSSHAFHIHKLCFQSSMCSATHGLLSSVPTIILCYFDFYYDTTHNKPTCSHLVRSIFIHLSLACFKNIGKLDPNLEQTRKAVPSTLIRDVSTTKTTSSRYPRKKTRFSNRAWTGFCPGKLEQEDPWVVKVWKQFRPAKLM